MYVSSGECIGVSGVIDMMSAKPKPGNNTKMNIRSLIMLGPAMYFGPERLAYDGQLIKATHKRASPLIACTGPGFVAKH